MEVSPFLALLLVALLSLLLFFFSAGRKTSPSHVDGRSLPPSPLGFPLLGHLPLLGSLPHRSLRSLAASHGPVMLLRLGRVPAVVVSSADAAQEALKTRDPAFASRFRSRMTERLFYGRDMAFVPYGEHWRRARRVCVLHLLSQRCVLSFRRVREQEAAALVGRVHAAATGTVNLSDLLISYASSVTIRATFGDCSSSTYGLGGGGRLRKVLDDLEDLLGSGTLGELVPWLGWVDSLTGLDAKATRTFEALDGLFERVVADHRERRRGGQRVGDGGGGGQRDFVDVLLDVNEEEDEAGGHWFDTVTIKAIILNMYVGSIDTTFATLEWAMAELMNHPDEMRRLQEEIRATAHDDDHIIVEDHLNKLPYLKLVIKETLRLHPPAPLVPRETVEDTELLGYHVPARTRVLVNVWAIGREPTAWERADEFLPERFAEDVDMDQYMLGQDFTLLPFGAGRRGCPGVGFAMASVELVLGNLLYHFNWSLPDGTSMVNMDEQGGLAVRLKKALHLVAMPWCS